jgi:hypothetical protein
MDSKAIVRNSAYYHYTEECRDACARDTGLKIDNEIQRKTVGSMIHVLISLLCLRNPIHNEHNAFSPGPTANKFMMIRVKEGLMIEIPYYLPPTHSLGVENQESIGGN